MELYAGHSAKLLTNSIAREVAGDNRFKPPEYPTVRNSISHTIGSCYSNPTIFKSNFKPTTVDIMPHRSLSLKPIEILNKNRNLDLINSIENSRKPHHNHNTFRSDYVIIDY